MDEFLILLLVLLVLGILIIPVITLVKLVSIGSRIGGIERELKQLRVLRYKEEAKENLHKAVETEKTTEPVVVEEEALVPPPIPVYIAADKKEEEFTPPVISEVIETTPTKETSQEEIKEEIQEEAKETIEETIEAGEPVEVPVFTMPSEEYDSVDIDLPPPPRPQTTKEFPTIRFENLLSKIGIVTLVLGIGFFVKYAIDKDWINEVGRVAIGVLTGGVLIGIAHYLRKKYELFSAIMVGGGISVLYITITLAFREYHLFSQGLAFGILIAITLFSVILSLVYNRKELALFSLLGGYASPLMISTGEGNYVVLFSFLLILNTGMLIISMYKKWNIIGIVSFVCTLIFYWSWLVTKFETQYTGALVFGILFFVQFYLLALFHHFLSGKKISPFQVALILANNLSMFAASIYIFNETQTDVRGLLTISMAVVNAIVMITLFRRSTVDKRLIYLIIAIVLSFVSLAIPIQLNGHVITMFWAAEIVILLWLWAKSGIKVFHVGFLLISVLTLVSYLMDVYHIYLNSGEYLPVVFNRIFVTGLVVIAAFTVSKLMIGRMKNAQNGLVDSNILNRYFILVIIGMSYLVPFLEIYYQFGSSQVEGISDFTSMMLAIYTTIYVTALTFVYTKKIAQETWPIIALTAFIMLYLVVGIPAITSLRSDVFYAKEHISLFLLHYISLPALACIFYTIIKNIKRLSKQACTILGWLLVVCAVVILSVELDNTIVQFWGTSDNYSDLLYDVRTFGYPILWGILAMILMIWGLKAKEALLRQISLGFFAFIILKFYISDIWLMSQTGHIISFVVLGIILLLVSFLIQKIKVLIKEDKEDTNERNIEE